jgi:glycosyltransferase involved in cell wall biosynthesis
MTADGSRNLDLEKRLSSQVSADAARGKCLEPIRVCHLTKYYPPAPGGIETHVSTLARAQVKLGADVHVVCVNHRNAKGRVITFQSLGITRTQIENSDSVSVRRVGRVASLARLDICPSLPVCLVGLQTAGFDVLHLHVPNPTMLLALALVGSSTPLVVTYHSDVVRQKLLGLMQRPFEYLVFNKARAIYCTSPMYAAGSPLLAKYADKVGCLPFGINPEPFSNPNKEALAYATRLRTEYGSPLWLAIGRLVYYKGLNTALRALASVPGRLLIIGEGPLREPLQKLATELGVADRVIWQGHASEDELAGAYQAATALWFPSNARSEAFGLVQVESMASGCPVINTAIPCSGVSWVCQHELTGLTVPIEDPEALAAAATRLLVEPGLRDRLSLHARQRASTEFHHLHMARRCLEAYVTAANLDPARIDAGGLLTSRDSPFDRAPCDAPLIEAH